MHERSSKLKIIYKYLVSAIILAVPLYPKFPLIEVPGTFVSVRLEDFLLALTFSFFVATVKKRNNKEVCQRNLQKNPAS